MILNISLLVCPTGFPTLVLLCTKYEDIYFVEVAGFFPRGVTDQGIRAHFLRVLSKDLPYDRAVSVIISPVIPR